MSTDGLADASSSDHRHGRYIISGNDSIDGEELANACRRLGISGPLEPLMRELKKDGQQSQHLHNSNDVQRHQYHSDVNNKKQDQNINQQQSQHHHHQSNHHHHHRKYASKSDKKTSSSIKHRENYNTNDDDGHHLLCGDSLRSAGGGKTSTYGQESWGRDSGARDLSPEPSTHRIPATSSGGDSQLTDNETGGGTTASMIHLANKVSTYFTHV